MDTKLIQFGDNHNRFMDFCNVQPNRNKRLGRIITDIILGDKKKNVRILDVGSSDGALLYDIYTNLTSENINFEMIATEPDPYAFVQLTQNMTLTGIRLVNESVENVLTSNDTFDYILCTHVLYHIGDLVTTIQRLKEKLIANGKLVIIIDSFNSPIYKLSEKLLVKISEHKTVRFYGKLISSAQIIKVLQSQAITFEIHPLLSYLEIKSVTVLIDVLQFILRLDRTVLSKKSKIIASIFSKYYNVSRKLYKLAWLEDMIIIKNDNYE
jgi:2-polyprenyl-3-methyl-5-hydroxy-6-metoxy-1,4-benzoquinol methylase